MNRRLAVILFFLNGTFIAQTIGDKFNSVVFQPTHFTTDFDSLRIISEKSNLDYVGFLRTKYDDKVIYDTKNHLFLFPNYYQDTIITHFNMFSSSGKPIVNWALNSIAFEGCHAIKYYRKKEKTIIIGCPHGEKCRYHGFNKKLFSGFTMYKTKDEFDEMLHEIIKQKR